MHSNQESNSSQIPHIPEEIITAINNKKLAVFIGAGVSRIIGCQGWDDQSKKIVEECLTIVDKNGNSVINEAQAKILLENENFNPKKRITICSDLLERAGCKDLFISLMKNTLKADEDKIKVYDIYKELVKFRALFITTNLDEYFDKHLLSKRIACLPVEFVRKLDRNKLYKIHGTISNKKSHVCTVPQYLNQYNDENLIKFLRGIFAEYIILFIGYGMEEFELLDFIFMKYDGKKNKELKHYILQRIKSNDEIDLYKAYYNQFGISVIPYIVDNTNNNQLYHIIQNWAAEIKEKSDYLNDSYKRIKEIIDEFDDSAIDELLQYVKDQSHKNHLCKILTETNNPLPWLEIFYNMGCFSPDKNPSPVESNEEIGYHRVPYWQILGYLKNVAKVNSNKNDEKITNLLIQIIDDFVNFQNNIQNKIDNNYTDWIIIKIIFLLPINKIKDDYFDFVRSALKTKWNTHLIAQEFVKTIFPKLIEQHATTHILQLLDIIFEYYQPKERTFEDYTGRIEPFWLNKILSKNKMGIAQLCSHDAAQVALDRANEICERDPSQFNNVWISAIESKDDNYMKDRYDRQIIDFIRDMLEQCEINKLNEIVHELIHRDHPIFNRIAIQIINKHYAELNEIFWNLDYNPLGKYQLKHECQVLLNSHNLGFSDEHNSQLIKWIEDDIYYIPDNPDISQKEKDTFIACSKLRWLFSFDKTENRDIAKLYEKYRNICPNNDLESYGESEESIFSGDDSPITSDELIEMTTDQIVKYLVEFKEEDGFRKPSVSGLADTFQEFIQNNAEEVIINLSLFESIPFVYQNAIFTGLNKSFKNSEIIEYNTIQSFISNQIKSDTFWDNEMSNDERMYRDQIVSSIGNIIIKGLQNDAVFNDSNQKSVMVNILITLGKKLKPYIREPDEYLDLPLISPQQTIYSAMFFFIIKNKGWNEEIKEFFEDRINFIDEESRDFFYTIGHFFSNLFYLDKEWVKEHSDKIFNVDTDTWTVMFAGYLSRSKPTQEIFRFIKQHDDYFKAISVLDNETIAKRNLVNHISIGYIYGEDTIEERKSLIIQYLNKNSTSQILNLIHSIWYIGKESSLAESQKGNIRQLWKYIIMNYSDMDASEDNKIIIAALFDWIIIFNKIDNELFDWLKQSAKYIHYGRNGLFFTEYLLTFIKNNPEEVGELIALYIENEPSHFYKTEDIREIVKVLYDLEYSELADKIYNLALSRNEYFLRDIFDNYHGHIDLGG